MMVVERATTPESAAPCSEQNNRSDDSTKCGLCGALVDVYQLGDGRGICTDHIGLVVSLAANDLYPGDVSYTRTFENVLMC